MNAAHVIKGFAQAAIFTVMVMLAMHSVIFVGYVVLVVTGVSPWVAMAGLGATVFAMSFAVYASTDLGPDQGTEASAAPEQREPAAVVLRAGCTPGGTPAPGAFGEVELKSPGIPNPQRSGNVAGRA